VNCKSHSKCPNGFTLFELILGLSLTVVILVAVGAAIDLHLRVLESRRSQIEEAQLARAVLRLIADDIRSAVVYAPIDFSGAEIAAAAGTVEGERGGETGEGERPEESPEGSELPGGEQPPGGGELPGGEGIPGGGEPLGGTGGITEGEPVEESNNTEDIASTVAPPILPGLYGNQFELQVDVSRLPRVDQYDPNLSTSTSMTDIPSDVKTVAFHLGADDSSELQSSGSLVEDSQTNTTGLIRRQLDRAVASWASTNGDISNLDANSEVVAPEVKYIEFNYFDGTEWLTEWDSQQQEGLPTAVRIVIGLDFSDSYDDPQLNPIANLGTDQTENLSYHSLVVYLPMSEASSPQLLPEEEQESTATSEEAE